MKPPFALSLLCWCLTTGLAHAGNEPFIQTNPDRSTVRLGVGYSSSKQKFFRECAKGFRVETGKTSGKFDLKLSADQQEVAQALGLQGGMRARVGAGELSASASFARASQESALSLTYSYIALYTLEENLVQGKEPMAPVLEINPSDNVVFDENCGDEVVTDVQKTAKLLVTLRVKFSSSSQKENFRAQFAYSSAIASGSAEAEKEFSKLSQGTELEINAFQIGGDPTRLGGLFCKNYAQDQLDCEKRSHKVLSCAFGQMAPCFEVIAGLMSYAHDQRDSESFPGQIKNAKNLVTTGYITSPYTRFGKRFPRPLKPSDRKDFEITIAGLFARYEESLKAYSLANQIALSKVPRITPEQRKNVIDLGRLAKENLDQISKAISTCYETGTTLCSSEGHRINKVVGYGSSEYLDEKKVLDSVQPQSFLHYCDLKLDDVTTSEGKSIQYLRAFFQKESGKSESQDVCSDMNTFFKGKESLNFSDFRPSNYSLENLTVLSFLPSLRKLNISNLGLSQLEGLGKLQQLEVLNLSNNVLSEIPGIESLANLKQLNVSSNKLRDLTGVSHLKKLNTLILAKNYRDLECPKNVQKCISDLLQMETSILVQNCGPFRASSALELKDGRVLVTGSSDFGNGTNGTMSAAIVSDGVCQMLPLPDLRRQLFHSMYQLDSDTIVLFGGTSSEPQFVSLSGQLKESEAVQAWRKVKIPGHIFSTYHVVPQASGEDWIVIIGGYIQTTRSQDLAGEVSSAVTVIQATSGRIVFNKQLRVPRALHSATVIDNQVLVVGGFDGKEVLSSVEKIDLNTGKISTLGRLAVPRAGHTADLRNNKLIVVGGLNFENKQTPGKPRRPQGLSLIEEFNPATAKSAIQNVELNQARALHASIPGPNGEVIALGGVETFSFAVFDEPEHPYALTSSEVLDFAKESVFPGANLNRSHVGSQLLQISEQSALWVGGVDTVGGFGGFDVEGIFILR